MISAYVNELAYALGEECYTVEDASKMGRLVSKPESLLDAGFRQHYVCSSDQNAYTMAKRAAASALPENVTLDAIVYATCLPCNGTIDGAATFSQTKDVKCLMDFPASHLQSELAADNAVVIGVNQQACTSMLGALRLARALILAEPDRMRSILCVTADRFPHGSLYEQSYNLISDGAAACLVSREPSGFRLLAFHQITNGSMACASDDETIGGFFSYSFKAMQEILMRSGLTIGDLSWIVPQNTNAKAWQILSRLLEFPFERIYFPSLPEVGHIISADNMVNLKHLHGAGKLIPGDKILLFMAGYGLNWQCAILEKV